jgi:DNA invertase Pin-like site-specific DNA recombinase
MVRSLSDVARSLKQCLSVLNQLNQLGIGFISCRDNIDTTGTLGQAMAVIVRGMVELERSLRIENVRAGMRRAKLEGVSLGRKPLDINRVEIVKDRGLGLSLTTVGRKHGVSRGTVCRLVKLAGGKADSLPAVHKIPPPSLNGHEPYPTFQVSAVPAMLGCASAES